MKLIITLIFGIVIFFLSNSITFSYCSIVSECVVLQKIEAEIEEKNEKKVKKQQQLLVLGQELEFDEKGTMSYLENYIFFLNLSNEINQSEIDIINLEHQYCVELEIYEKNCSENPEIDLYNTKILINDKNLIEVQKELDLKLEEEKKIQEEAEEKAKQEKEAKLLEEAKNISSEYLKNAELEFQNGKYEKANSTYENACKVLKTFDCYYGQALSSYEITKVYYKKSLNFPSKNEKLFKSTKEDTVYLIEKAIDYGLNEEEKNKAEELLIEVSNYPNEVVVVVQKEPIKEISEDSIMSEIDRKVEIVWGRLETITLEYSDEKKQDIYIRLITTLEKYKMKITNQNITPLLDALIEKISLNIAE